MSTEHQQNSERTWLRDARMAAEKLSVLVQSSPLGIIAVDLDGIIRFWNNAAGKITGWREDEALGRPIRMFPGDRWEVYEEVRRRTLQLEIFTSLPVHAVKKDGTPMHVSYSAAPLLDAENHVVGTVAILYDITEKMELEAALKASLEKMNRVVDETVEALASAVESRDLYTASHQKRVASLVYAIAEEMRGIGNDQMKGIRTAAVLHDIGKLHVPFELLNNPGHLTDIELELIKRHPQAGCDILKNIEFPWPVARTIQQHHERLDGSGYPAGLRGDSILLEARIIGVADVVESMSSHRPYRPGKGINAALQEITRARGSFYDPEAVDACLALFRKGFVLSGE